MGNAALCAGRGNDDAITVLTADGSALTFDHSIRVVDIILEFPNHFMCHSSSLVLMQQVTILPPRTTLIPGEVYFLIPIPGREVQSDCRPEDSADTESLLHTDPPQRKHQTSGSMKFVISTEQFSRILSGSIKGGKPKLKRKNQQRLPKNGNPPFAPNAWQPRLSSIEEIEAK